MIYLELKLTAMVTNEDKREWRFYRREETILVTDATTLQMCFSTILVTNEDYNIEAFNFLKPPNALLPIPELFCTDLAANRKQHLPLYSIAPNDGYAMIYGGTFSDLL